MVVLTRGDPSHLDLPLESLPPGSHPIITESGTGTTLAGNPFGILLDPSCSMRYVYKNPYNQVARRWSMQPRHLFIVTNPYRVTPLFAV